MGYIKLRQEIEIETTPGQPEVLPPGLVCDLGRARNERLISEGVADNATPEDLAADAEAHAPPEASSKRRGK